MKAYKGFDKNMKCLGFQFAEGETYEEETAKLCESGFHACENPLDCFGYYEPGKGSIYREVELDEVSEETSDDTKRVGKRIKIGAEIDVAGIVKASFEYTKERTTNADEGKDHSALSARNHSALSAQDYSALSARNHSALSAQDCSALSAQDCSALSAGKHSVLSVFNGKCKAGIGSLIAIANHEFDWNSGDYKIVDFACAIVDGETVKADTWYECEGGKLVDAKDDED